MLIGQMLNWKKKSGSGDGSNRKFADLEGSRDGTESDSRRKEDQVQLFYWICFDTIDSD